ncbi:MAG: peptidoglycan recognition protein family protein [Planctomycetes bacterium]|nr:peptidoglycan recognition protein family protein [Planctomycetota bacterium]
MLVLSGLFVACSSPSAIPAPAPSVAVEDPGPDLTGPLSWQKLEHIEEWLQTPESQRSPDFRVELELQLHEGRVTFAQRDAERANVPDDSLRVRLEAARDGFRSLLARNALMPGQSARAQIGLRAADSLLASLVKPASAVKPALVIIDRSRWGAAPPAPTRLTPLKGAWSRITIHHSAEESSDGKGGSLEDSAHTLRLIQKFHMEDPGHRWGDIGYHFLIDSGGRIFEGRELRWQGAHAGGKDGMYNAQNVGVCLLGDFRVRPPTPAAMKSLELLIADLREKHKIAASRVYAHTEFTGSVCPGPFLIDWVKKHR